MDITEILLKSAAIVSAVVLVVLAIKWLFVGKKAEPSVAAKPKRSPRRARKAKPRPRKRATKARRKKKVIKPSNRMSTKHSRK